MEFETNMATIPTYMTKKGVLTAGHGIIKSGLAASEIPFGAVVTRSADGTIKATPSSGTYAYLGVAINDNRKQNPYDGFYAAGKKVPFVATGTANVLLLGGETVDSGDFVTIADVTLGAGTESLGVVVPEDTATTRTAYSIGRVLDSADSGDTDYDQSISSISADIVTFGSSAVKDYLDLNEGDYIVIDSAQTAEVNMVADADYSSTAIKMVKNPLSAHSSAIKAYTLTQIEVELI